MRLPSSLAGVFVALLCLARGVSADVILLIDDQATPGVYEVIIADNASTGTPTFFGLTTQGDGWDAAMEALTGVYTTVAMSTPVSTTNWDIGMATTGFGYGGGPDPAGVDLLMDAFSLGAGSLTGTVVFTGAELDFELTSINSSIGGYTDDPGGTPPGGTVNYAVGFDDGNGYSPPLVIGPTSLTPDPLGAFGNSQSVVVTGTNPFSLSVTGTFNASGAGYTFGFDASGETNPVPEPTSLVLFGTFSAVGFGVLRYRRRKKRSDTPAPPAG